MLGLIGEGRFSRKGQKRLSATLFLTILVYSVVVILCFAGIFSALFYFTHEKGEEARLLSIARSAAAVLNAESDADASQILKDQFESDIRYTIIDPNGEVLFDTRSNSHVDHSDRPEIQRAHEKGSASVIRFSNTLGEDTIYAAIVLDSGDILRLSEQRESFLSVMGSVAFPLGLAVVVVTLLSIILSRVLTKKIVSPLSRIDVADPLESDTYSEMQPLLHRIHDQQQQLLEQNRELDRAENLRKEFSANVTHEMKTPLQVISGYSELLARGNIPAEDIERFSAIIFEESSNMADLIDDILTLSRLDDSVMENAGKEELDVLEVARDAVARLNPLAEKHDVRIKVLGSSAEIMGNRGLLDQLVTNLVSNAVKYSEPGKDIAVCVGKRLIPIDEQSAPEVYIKVRDEGCGIPEEDLDKIFERFYRVDKSRSKASGGTGLGLAIAKHAAEFHGASISVKSSLGKGSVFIVHIPIDDERRTE